MKNIISAIAAVALMVSPVSAKEVEKENQDAGGASLVLILTALSAAIVSIVLFSSNSDDTPVSP